jgi:hypothetical protein
MRGYLDVRVAGASNDRAPRATAIALGRVQDETKRILVVLTAEWSFHVFGLFFFACHGGFVPLVKCTLEELSCALQAVEHSCIHACMRMQTSISAASTNPLKNSNIHVHLRTCIHT